MPFLVVDDRDGRVVAELSEVDALSVLEAMARGERMPDHLSLVDCHSNHGALLGTDSTIKIVGTLM